MASLVDTTLLFQIHLCSAIGANLLMIAAGVIAFFYMFQDWRLRKKKVHSPTKLPSLYKLDDLGIRLLTSAFVLMTVGMIAGSVLAEQLWGEYWYFDPRQIWSVMVWFLFCAILIARFMAGWRGRKASAVSVLGVVLMLSGHVVISSIDSTRHSIFGSNDNTDYRDTL